MMAGRPFFSVLLRCYPAHARERFESGMRFAFAMPLGLTGADMSSLDGSTGVAEQAVREKVDQLLGEIAK